ncbi:hypothetical protein BB561_005940 [Smittium simulii]|uniref:Uncharacterized protein n=1 Tax=Smittium simulii TaxID=133385 RepID=A0A2T9Y7H1_9FUNG|nr:hypothetical protein BB561_005940 [Smittium simulii]
MVIKAIIQAVTTYGDKLAIGATLAANSGVSTDDIVSHAFWSNYSIFDSYYRLTRNSSNNLTESILNLE